MLSLLGHRLDPWPRNFYMLQGAVKKREGGGVGEDKDKEKGKREESGHLIIYLGDLQNQSNINDKEFPSWLNGNEPD